ncbi:MAG: CopD family protein [Gemmatimonadaceae bacterium]
MILLHELALVVRDAVAQAGTSSGPTGPRVPGGPPPGFSGLEAVTHFVEFVGDFLAIGAVGFRYGLVRRLRGVSDDARAILRADNAAALGIIGILLLALVALGSPILNGLVHGKTIAESFPRNPSRLYFKGTTLAIALGGFLLVRKRPSLGWAIAAVAVLFTVLQPLYTGKLAGKVNAVHILAASTWLGTLLVLTIVGIRGSMSRIAPGTERARLIADLVNSFSPLALTAATVVVLTGATTAWLHLKRISALWTSSYGISLMVKLVLVLVVASLGAWNWKRVRPSLGESGSEHAIRKSSTMELTFAFLVLVATSVLVTLPSPK